MEKIIVIVGPTGVGKTKLSIELAKRLNAEIINGDSVAIFKKLNIGSAKPTIDERENIPHHLLDIKDVSEDYSVYDYQKDARKAIKDITSRGKRVIIVGGTGLYIKAALYDYHFPEQTTKNNYLNYSQEELITEIKNYNVEIPDINNRRRLERLLQKLEEGQEITSNKDKALYPHIVIGLTTDREKLYKIINNRVDKMIDNGLLNEIKSLKDYYKKSRILNSGIGYKEFNDYLFNDQSLEETIEKVKLNSRRLAKRQYTFFKHQFNTIWYEVNYQDFNKTIDTIYNYIKKEDLK